MFPCRHRTQVPAVQELSRERIIPPPLVAQTFQWDASAVIVRGSLPVSALALLTAAGGDFPARGLPILVLFVTAAHGSALVRQRICRR